MENLVLLRKSGQFVLPGKYRFGIASTKQKILYGKCLENREYGIVLKKKNLWELQLD